MAIEDWDRWGFLKADEEILNLIVYKEKNEKADYHPTGSKNSFFEARSEKGNGMAQFFLLCLSIGLRVNDGHNYPSGSTIIKGVTATGFPKAPNLSREEKKEKGYWYRNITYLAEMYDIELGQDINRHASIGLNYIYKHHFNIHDGMLDIKGIIEVFAENSETVMCNSCRKHNVKDKLVKKCTNCDSKLI